MKFDRESKENTEIQEALAKVVFLKVDAEKGEGVDLAERYSVSGYPTWILTNAQGDPLDRWAGYGGPDHFTTALQAGLDDPTTVEQKIVRYEEQATLQDAEKIARILSGSGNFERGIEFYHNAAELDENSDYAYEIFETSVQACRKDVFELEVVTEAAQAALASEQVSPSNKGMIYYYAHWLGGKKELADYELQFLAPAYEAVRLSEDEEVQGMATDLSIEHAMRVEEDLPKAVELKFASMPEGWQEDPQQLNAYAWWCFENQIDLERGETLALEAVASLEAGPDRAAILDTAAELCRSLGKREQALTLLEQASEEDPASEEYRTKLKDWRQAES